jgi:hypothetical protein
LITLQYGSSSLIDARIFSFEHTVNQKDRAQGGKMYVCICNAFTERQVSIAIHTGVSSPAGVFRHLGCRRVSPSWLRTSVRQVRAHGALHGEK